MQRIRYWIKRRILLGWLKRICKKKNYALVLHRSLTEYRDGDDDGRDFEIRTENTVFSVKIIPVRSRISVFRLSHNGTYSIGEGTYLPQAYYFNHREIAYRPKIFRKLPRAEVPVPESGGKQVRHVFLVHPTCYEYECVSPGGRRIASPGDTFLGWELWCGRDFRKMLKKL